MANVQEDKAGAIRPTLFIGVGGTGKEILLRLRRKFYERFGDTRLPCVAYLWLDTDTKDRLALGEPVDEIFRAVAFKEDECFALLHGKVKEDLSGVFLNKGQHPHIHRWIYPEVERFGGEISDGAGGIRAVGRLTFFHHYADIDRRIKAELQRISTQEVIDKTEAWIGHADFDITPQVFLIASIAGGTGCGIMLDMAFLLSKISGEGIALERRVGMLVLPNVYFPTPTGEVAERSYGNAYAALKELEFYTLGTNDTDHTKRDGIGISAKFEAEWEKGSQKRIQGPPFSVTYILERQNEGDIGLQTRSELFYMAAESLFLDFMPGEFSSAKRSQYSNVAQYLTGADARTIAYDEVELSQAFARRYASFGMSKIEIPIDLVKGACASELGCEIIQYWRRETVNPDIRTHIREDMSQRAFSSDGLIGRFGTGWREIIASEVNAIFRGLSIKEAKDLNDLEKKTEDFDRKVLREEGTDSTKWGTVIASIRGNRPKVLGELKQDLLQWLRDTLEAPSRGLKGLVQQDGYLRYLTEDLKGFYTSEGEGHTPEYQIKKEAADRDAVFLKAEREKNQRDLKTALSNLGVALLALKPWTVDTLTQRLKDAVQQYALARAEICLLEEAQAVAKGAREFLEEKRPMLQKFLSLLDEFSARFKARKDAYLNFGEGVLFIRYFDRDRDWGEFYALGVDNEGRRGSVNPQQEHRRFLDEISGAKSTLWEVVEALGKEGEKNIEAKLSAFCEKSFLSDFASHPREINILEHPELQEKQRLNAVVKKLVRCALPMAKRDSKLGAEDVAAQKLAYLGIAKPDGEPYASFVESVRGLLQAEGYAQLNVLPTGKPWEVYLYIVSYAFPLPSLPTIKHECHKAYYDFYQAHRAGGANQKFRIPLHLSRQWEGKFDDLVVYGDQEAKEIKKAFEGLLFGSILRVLDVKPVDERLEYGYKKWIPPAARVEPLGNRREAVEVLRTDARLCDSMITELLQREHQLVGPQLQSYYWLLSFLDFSELLPFGSPERSLIVNKLNKLYERLAGQVEDLGQLSLDHLPKQEHMGEAKKRLGVNAEWIGTFPVLKGLDVWVRR